MRASHVILIVMAVMVALIAIVGPVSAEEAFPGWHDAADPAGPLGKAVARGRLILTHTAQNAAAYSGNALNCTSCHLDAGRTPWAAPWVGIWGVFPEYR